MKKYVSIIISLFISLSIYSQQNFESGYVITNHGDSISGFIDYRNWNINPIDFKFKTSLDTEEIIYSIKEIKSFKVHNELYVNAEVEVEISARSSSELKFDSELKLEKQQVFLLAIVQGAKSLYYLRDGFGNEHFFIRSQDKYMLLLYKKYIKDSGYEQHVVENERYKGQLSYYLIDCPKIKTSISRAIYTRASLVGIFEDYYSQCANSKVAIITKTEKSVLSFGLIAGLSNTQIKFGGASQGLTKSTFSKSTNIYAGGFFEIDISRSQKRLSLYNELAYTSYNVTGTYKFNNDQILYEIGTSNIILLNMIRYKRPIGKLSIFANTGFANSFVLGVTNSRKVKYEFHDTVEERKALDEIKKWSLGGAFGGGVNWKSISLEYRYQICSGISKYESLSSWTHRHIFLLGYRF